MSYLEGADARADAGSQSYYAYHLLKCDNVFAKPPTLRCEHCVAVPPAHSGHEPAPQSEAPGHEWTRVTETLPPSGTWGCSNEGGDGKVCNGAGGVEAEESAESGVPWPKTVWLREEAAALVSSLSPDMASFSLSLPCLCVWCCSCACRGPAYQSVYLSGSSLCERGRALSSGGRGQMVLGRGVLGVYYRRSALCRRVPPLQNAWTMAHGWW